MLQRLSECPFQTAYLTQVVVSSENKCRFAKTLSQTEPLMSQLASGRYSCSLKIQLAQVPDHWEELLIVFDLAAKLGGSPKRLHPIFGGKTESARVRGAES